MTANKRMAFGLVLVLGCIPGAALAQTASFEPADAGESASDAATSADSTDREGVSVHQQATDDVYQPWTTADGTKMLRVTPGGSAHLRIKRCDNGRLISAEQGDPACRPN